MCQSIKVDTLELQVDCDKNYCKIDRFIMQILFAQSSNHLFGPYYSMTCIVSLTSQNGLGFGPEPYVLLHYSPPTKRRSSHPLG